MKINKNNNNKEPQNTLINETGYGDESGKLERNMET